MSEAARRFAALSPEQQEMLLARLREEKKKSAPEVPRIPEGPVDRSAPVPLTDAQEAFWIGGSGLFDLGGSGANVYLEYEVPVASAWTFADDLSAGLQRMIERHEVLRTVILPDGTQQVLSEVPPFRVQIEDASVLGAEEAERRLAEIRERLRYGRHRTDRWPLFEIVVQQVGDGRVRLHARFDALLLDGPARSVLVDELAVLVLRPDRELPPLDVSFLDHARALAAFRDSATYRRSRAYWLDRLPSLPPLPRLPLTRDPAPDTIPRIVKRSSPLLAAEPWRSLQQRARREGITPTAILTAAFAATLSAWSDGPDFLLGLMGAYRPEIHPRIDRVIGNFNILHLLAAEGGEVPFVQRAKLLQKRLLADLDHQHYSGHQVLRELRRREGAGGRALLPVVFDSVVEYSHASYDEGPPPAPAEESRPAGEESLRPRMTEIDLMISLPQVLLLCVVLEAGDGSLELIGQAVEEILPEGLVPELIETYRGLLLRLATEEASWLETSPVRPPVPASTSFDPAAWELLPGDRLLAVSSELCGALAGPASILRPGPEDLGDPGRLAAFAAREKVTVWASPPALLEAALDAAERGAPEALSSLRLALLHGDRVPVSLPARLAALCPGARLGALWGAGEIPWAAGALEAADFAEPAVGRLRVRPLPGYDARVLARSGAPRPAWVEGEIHAGLRGRLAPTGELGRLLPDGRLEIVESRAGLVRVEAALERHPGVGRALVARLPDGSEAAGGRGRLAAWIVPRGARRPGEEDLRRHLLGSLPGHLVPEAFAVLDRAPLTVDGRIDRAALPPIPKPPGRSTSEWSELENELAALWEEVLGRRPASAEDDFFELGGDSLRAVRLTARLAERFGLEGPLAGFLERPTLGRLAELVEQARAEREREEKAERSPVRRLRASLARLRDRILPPATSPSYGMRLFLLLWFSQFVSGVGTGLGSFALGVWVYRQNASATQYSMMAFLATCAGLVVGPLAGVLADRWDRRKLILLGDSGAAVMTALMAVALYTGQMRLWYVYVIVVFMVGFAALQGPALTASISLLVPRRQLGRASGMAQAAGTATGLICPPLAGVLVGRIGYHGVILLDLATFLFAFAVLLILRLPRPPVTPAHRGQRSMVQDFLFGWTYIRQRPGLFHLLGLFAMTNFSIAIVQVLLTPLILSFGTATELGTVQSAAVAGTLVGSVALSVWGGPRHRTAGILLFVLLKAPILLLGALQPSVALIALASFLYMGLNPFTSGLSQAIWQSKVEHDVQGRVFAMRGLLAMAMTPLAFLLAGPLNDYVFEPLLAAGGPLADTAVGRLIGVGPGRGTALLFVSIGLLILLAAAAAALSPRLRRVEEELPDAAEASPVPQS